MRRGSEQSKKVKPNKNKSASSNTVREYDSMFIDNKIVKCIILKNKSPMPDKEFQVTIIVKAKDIFNNYSRIEKGLTRVINQEKFSKLESYLDNPHSKLEIRSSNLFYDDIKNILV